LLQSTNCLVLTFILFEVIPLLWRGCRVSGGGG